MKSILNRAKAKLKENKGFTLIEIIVVLVILAILAAAAIPSLLGFIEDSRAKAITAEARAAFIAAQAIITEEMATGSTDIQLANGLSAGTRPGAATVNQRRIWDKFQRMLQPDITIATLNTVNSAASAGTNQASINVLQGNIRDGRLVLLTYTKRLDSGRSAQIIISPPNAARYTIDAAPTPDPNPAP